MLIRFSKAFVVFIALAGSAQAGVPGDIKTAALTRPDVAPVPSTADLAERIDTLIMQRATMMNTVAPQPKADANDPQLVARRLAALRELDIFARATINGLIDAAPSKALKEAMADELAPVLILHEEDMAEHLVSLLNLPLVQDQGWFVISRFGAEAERNAAKLVAGAAMDPIYKAELAKKIGGLAARGEATAESSASLTISKKQ